MVDGGNFVDRIVLHRLGDRGTNDEVIFVGIVAHMECQLEQELVGPLDVVHKFLPLGAGIAQLGYEPRHFAVILLGLLKRIDPNTPVVAHDIFHCIAHFIVELNYFFFGLSWGTDLEFLAVAMELYQGPIVEGMHFAQMILVFGGQKSLKIGSVEHNLT